MCINPSRLVTGDLVACRNCWQCWETKIADWQGRCIAEGKTSKAAHCVTLTYGRSYEGEVNHARSLILTYSDIQKYFKLLRKHGYPCRYFAVGEYGGEKGRSHWHCIIYWQDKVPEHEIQKYYYMQKHWPHGFSWWEPVGPKAVRYIMKYLHKGFQTEMQTVDNQSHMAMSKKPPLGAVYFAQLAGQYVQQGLAPQGLYYTFPEVKDKNGKPLKFLMRGKTAENFLDEYILQWRGLPRPWNMQGPPVYTGRSKHYPASDLVEEHEDKRVREWKIPDEWVDKQILDKTKKGKHQWQENDQATARTKILPPIDVMLRYQQQHDDPV